MQASSTSATLTPSLYTTQPRTPRCSRYSQDNHVSCSCRFGATLAQSELRFIERTRVPQSSPRYQANSPQDAASVIGGAATHETYGIPRPLLSSPDSGMIVFSSSARILHMNGAARTLMALFGASHERWPQMGPESMPSILTDFCYDVLAQLRRRIEAQDWTQFEMRHTCHMVTPSLLLTGFGVPTSSNREIRIILTLTPLPSDPGTFADSMRHCMPDNVRIPVDSATL
jgi:hypothetical protein